MPWKKPNRPEHEISQSYNDGVVTIYSVTDEAEPGYQPREALTELAKLCYENRKLGIQRYYQGKQNQTEVKRVIRVPHMPQKITNRDKAVTEDGAEYRIDLVQLVPDVWPLSDDLTLAAYRQGVSG